MSSSSYHNLSRNYSRDADDESCSISIDPSMNVDDILNEVEEDEDDIVARHHPHHPTTVTTMSSSSYNNLRSMVCFAGKSYSCDADDESRSISIDPNSTPKSKQRDYPKLIKRRQGIQTRYRFWESNEKQRLV
eukprot:CAMPEP_0194443650 /NCGR_PEP_ID=MMETSP0176-20130528/126831_1 /TAXON_ID=216777 /ORGANISM="Proboscia alata, Strain PI-D3" /LENGTH=132 /DNA_ID=CAMNT_0039269935 /DNA_START=1837 /DNA_END=2235 /DNA_ORIENTATION=+